MKSQQIPNSDDVLDLAPQNSPEYRCAVCGKPTTIRYDSVPICASCAKWSGL
ncbi:MAG TPA: hypothetical protein VE955_00540 [Candidatus Dormibacteraeota bacterium]|nr:hypothetical protein [Candidatus Dormibacteraeota bacterium]